jgi:hypothetical protein
MNVDSSSNHGQAGGKRTSRGRKILQWVGGILLVLILAAIACLTIGYLYVTVMSRSLARDCYWEAYAFAFEDVNADGIYQEEEPPMEGVQLSLFVYYRNGRQKGSESPFVTGKDGKVHVGTFLPGCPDVTFKLISQLPEGYEFTTPGEIETDDYHLQDSIPFGFAPRKLITTPSP